MAIGNAKDNLIGAIWMVAAMLGFAIEDSFFKAASQTLPIGQALVLIGALGAFIFATLIRRAGDPIYRPEVLAPAMRIRAIFEISGRLFFFLALALAPLTSATVILQATPLVVVAGAALFLGEHVGWRRWLAILVGLVGVMIVLQPGAASFTYASGFAVLGMLGFAGRDLASRAAPAALSTATLGFYGFLAIIVAGVIYRYWSGEVFEQVTFENMALCLLTSVFGVLGYSALMKAMRTGEVASVAPFRYSRLLFGVGIGVLWFGEALTPNMLLGSLLIVASGVFILRRGRKNSPQSGG